MAFRNSAATLNNVDTVIYTCPTNYECVFHSLYFSNLDPLNTIAVEASIEYNKNPALGTRTVIKNVSIPAGTSLIFDKPITLRPGDVLRAKCSVAGMCDAIGSMLLTLEDTTAPN